MPYFNQQFIILFILNNDDSPHSPPVYALMPILHQSLEVKIVIHPVDYNTPESTFPLVSPSQFT